MEENEIQPDVVTYGTAMTACARGERHDQCKILFDQMVSSGIEPNKYTYNTALWSISKCGDWQRGLDLLTQMNQSTNESVRPNVTNYRKVIEVCQKHGREEEVQILLKEIANIKTASSSRTRPEEGEVVVQKGKLGLVVGD